MNHPRFFFPVALLSVLPAFGEDQAALKANLDLPYNAVGELDADEDELLQVVTFYGTQLEGDGFFYVIDTSASMCDSGELKVAKEEFRRNLAEFTEDVEFGVVLFSSLACSFPEGPEPVPASEAMKAGALGFVEAPWCLFGGTTCVRDGLELGLEMANRSSARRRVLVFVGDGGGTCETSFGVNQKEEDVYLAETLNYVREHNYHRIVIHTVGVVDVEPPGEEFLKALAQENGGTYRRIDK